MCLENHFRMKKTLTLAVCTLFYVYNVYAQDTAKHVRGELIFPAVTADDFLPTNYYVDTSAAAVYLIDAGYTLTEGGKITFFDLRQKFFKRIKLLKRSSFTDLATVEINLVGTKKLQVIRLENFNACTYNVENGKLIKTIIDKNSFFTTTDGLVQNIKFTFPDIKEGSIIEYSYDLVSPSIGLLPPWSFQEKYPKIMSECTLEIPAVKNLLTFTNGFLKPCLDSVESMHINYQNPFFDDILSIKDNPKINNTIRHKWVYENIPAIKKEKFVDNTNDYFQYMEFHRLNDYNIFSDTLYADWQSAAEHLLLDEDFGLSLAQNNNFFKDDLRDILNNEKDTLQIARKIYYAIKKNYNCTRYSGKYLTKTLKELTKSKKGTAGDINLLLEAYLAKEGIEALPVIISTRGNGRPPTEYPITAKYNYVIVVAYINNKRYYLDAADEDAEFGILPQKCYNGNAWAISNPTFLLPFSADSLIETSVTNAFFINEGSDSLSGTINTSLGNMESMGMRQIIKEKKLEDYFKEIKKDYEFDVVMKNETADTLALKDPENPITLSYDVDFKPEGEHFYFNPMMAEAIKENPFASAERICPIEMPYCSDYTYMLNMEIPKGYTVEELPKPARITLNENEGMFEYLISQDDNYIQLRCRLQMNKANFLAEDYQTLRDFYAFVVEKENEQIVFKQKE